MRTGGWRQTAVQSDDLFIAVEQEDVQFPHAFVRNIQPALKVGYGGGKVIGAALLERERGGGRGQLVAEYLKVSEQRQSLHL